MKKFIKIMRIANNVTYSNDAILFYNNEKEEYCIVKTSIWSISQKDYSHLEGICIFKRKEEFR